MTQLYQTIEDQENPDYIESNGAFWCDDTNAWLGCGYYFWENYIENAHWWGRTRYSNSGYVICKSSYLNDPSTCFDLVDNYEHIKTLRDTIEELKKQGYYNDNKTTIYRIIEFLKEMNLFEYKAARISIPNSRNKKSANDLHIPVGPNTMLCYDLAPQVQVYFYDKTLISVGGYSIIYPEKYIDGYLV